MTGLEPGGGWPKFESRPIDILELLAQFHEWLGESLRVETRHLGGGGETTFYAKLQKVERGIDAGNYLVRFAGEDTTVTLAMPGLRVLRISGPGGRTGWIEFKAGRRLVVEIGLADADEAWGFR